MTNIVTELRKLHSEIVASDGHECEMMALVRRAADEIAQLRGNLSLAEEGLANYALEVERKNSLIDLQVVAQESLHDENVRLRVENEQLQSRLKRHEPVSHYNGHDIEWWKGEAERLRGALESIRAEENERGNTGGVVWYIAVDALGGLPSEPVPAPEASILKAFARSPRRIEPNDRRGHADWCPAAGSADAGDPRCTCIKPVAVSGIKVVVDPTMPPDEMMMRNSFGQEVRVTGIGAGIPPDGAPSMPFDRAAILAAPRERRISMSFETQEQYEAALIFLDMADAPEKSRVVEESGPDDPPTRY